MKENLFGITPTHLRALSGQLGMPAYRGRQLAEWLYAQHAVDLSEMTNISKADRTRLSERFEIRHADPIDRRVSADGTLKYAFRAEPAERTDGAPRKRPHAEAERRATAHVESIRVVEATVIPDGERRTLCLSTQIGCARRCAICATGRLGFHGNLAADAILDQFERLPEREHITNVVYMGMGEPLDNIGAVLESLAVFTDDAGYGLSPRRITVSTIGIPEPLERLLAESEAHVAVSLHSPFPAERRRLIPAEHRHPVSETLEVLRRYRWGGQRRLSFEYALIDHTNDTEAHAKAIARLIEGIPARMNLIPVNRADTGFTPPAAPRIEAFQRALLNAGVRTTIRASRGADIDAACGLLAGRVSTPGGSSQD